MRYGVQGGGTDGGVGNYGADTRALARPFILIGEDGRPLGSARFGWLTARSGWLVGRGALLLDATTTTITTEHYHHHHHHCYYYQQDCCISIRTYT